MSCSRIENDYDGITHDYTKKQGLVYEKVFLPSHAPPEWSDRAVLWNAVEEAEKSKDSRLAREFIVALPNEIDSFSQKYIAESFAKSLADDGMCVDLCIHDTDGHNPHAHILTTVRPLNPDGTWQPKTQKEYLCIRDGIEKGFTASEFFSVKNEGWEKQYQYYVGDSKQYLPPSQAEGLKRVSKNPKSTRFGRQNPTTERWNSEEQLLKWRKDWECEINSFFSSMNIPVSIDCRSNKDRGITEQPTIHEGVSAKKSSKSDRKEINRLIRNDNNLIKSLKATVSELTAKIKGFVSDIAKELETIRINLITNDYNLHIVRQRKNFVERKIYDNEYAVNRFGELKAIIKDEQQLLKQKQRIHKVTPKALNRDKYYEQQREIAEIQRDISELNYEFDRLCYDYGINESSGVQKLENDIVRQRQTLPKFDIESDNLTAKINSLAEKFKSVKSLNNSKDDLEWERLQIRPDIEEAVKTKLDVYRFEIREELFNDCVDEISEMLNEEPPHYKTRALIEYEKQLAREEEIRKQQKIERQQQNIGYKKPRDKSYER